MTSFPAATEEVIRHRGGGRDENGQLIAATPTPLLAIGVAPGAGWEQTGRVERGRDGESIACTVYFLAGTDLVNSDELTVRGDRYQIIVNEWRIGGGPVGGLEVRCTRGQG